MKLEEKTVLKSRANVLAHWNDKEWWYSGVYDPDSGVYFSFHFIRVNITDSFGFTVFDPREPKPMVFRQNMYLDSKQEKDRLCLNYHSRKLMIGYNGDEKNGWEFRFKNKNFEVSLAIRPTAPWFIKFDNFFVRQYTLLHFFHNQVSGTVRANGRTYQLKRGLGYYDHCFGRVPRRSGWHWIAVQNSEGALASLMNYGTYAQKYTQIYFRENPGNGKLSQWHRLNHEVSFEYDPDTKYDTTWRLTSPDMEVTVTPLMHALDRTKIPPLVPGLININHDEFFIKAGGRIRVDNEWVEVTDLYGVLEEHYGLW